jgi:hypothetical protein
MRLWRAVVIMIGLTLAALAVGLGPALAAVPTRDQAILNQRTETATVKVRLLDTTKKTGTSAKGIRCATTTGQRGTTRDTSQAPAPNGGDQRIRQFDPSIQRAPDGAGAPPGQILVNPGRNAQQRALMDGTSTVIGGVETQQVIVPQTQAQYRQMSLGVGTAPTVMGALDQNSAVRLQNGLTWSQATQSANLLVQALNTTNLFNVGQLSAGAGGMMTGLPLPNPSGGRCAAGMIGQGTAEDPCRPAAILCSTTALGAAVDPNCVTPRTIDSAGNVRTYLGGVQDSARAAVMSAPPAPGADLAAALQPTR